VPGPEKRLNAEKGERDYGAQENVEKLKSGKRSQTEGETRKAESRNWEAGAANAEKLKS